MSVLDTKRDAIVLDGSASNTLRLKPLGKPTFVSTPNIVGLTSTAAIAALATADLLPGTITLSHGSVASQWPTVSTQVGAFSTVDFTLTS